MTNTVPPVVVSHQMTYEERQRSDLGMIQEYTTPIKYTVL